MPRTRGTARKTTRKTTIKMALQQPGTLIRTRSAIESSNSSRTMKAIRKESLDKQIHPYLNDCSFQVGERVFDANKAILAINSDVFCAMFFSDLMEKVFPIRITDLTPDAFEVMLNYIYGQGLTVNSVTVAIESLQAANKYMLQEMIDDLDTYLSGKISVKEVFEAYESAKLYQCGKIIEKCNKLFQENTGEILKQEKFMDANLQTLADLFSFDNLDIKSEKDLIMAFDGYVHQNKLIRTEESPNTAMEPVIRQIRFTTIQHNELFETLIPIEWLYPKEKFALVGNAAAGSEKVHLETISFSSIGRGLLNHPFIQRLKRGKQAGKLPTYMIHSCYNNSYGYNQQQQHPYDTALWNCAKASGTNQIQELTKACDRFRIQKSLTAILDSNNIEILQLLSNLPSNVTELYDNL